MMYAHTPFTCCDHTCRSAYCLYLHAWQTYYKRTIRYASYIAHALTQCALFTLTRSQHNTCMHASYQVHTACMTHTAYMICTAYMVHTTYTVHTT